MSHVLKLSRIASISTLSSLFHRCTLVIFSLYVEAFAVKDREFLRAAKGRARVPGDSGDHAISFFGDYELTIFLTTTSFDEDLVSSILIV